MKESLKTSSQICDGLHYEFNECLHTLELRISSSISSNWEDCSKCLDQIEMALSEGKVKIVAFKCEMPNGATMNFALWVLKILDRHKWNRKGAIEIHWNSYEDEPQKESIEQALSKSFDLDIKYTSHKRSDLLIGDK